MTGQLLFSRWHGAAHLTRKRLRCLISATICAAAAGVVLAPTASAITDGNGSWIEHYAFTSQDSYVDSWGDVGQFYVRISPEGDVTHASTGNALDHVEIDGYAPDICHGGYPYPVTWSATVPASELKISPDDSSASLSIQGTDGVAVDGTAYDQSCGVYRPFDLQLYMDAPSGPFVEQESDPYGWCYHAAGQSSCMDTRREGDGSAAGVPGGFWSGSYFLWCVTGSGASCGGDGTDIEPGEFAQTEINKEVTVQQSSTYPVYGAVNQAEGVVQGAASAANGSASYGSGVCTVTSSWQVTVSQATVTYSNPQCENSGAYATVTGLLWPNIGTTESGNQGGWGPTWTNVYPFSPVGGSCLAGQLGSGLSSVVTGALTGTGAGALATVEWKVPTASGTSAVLWNSTEHHVLTSNSPVGSCPATLNGRATIQVNRVDAGAP